MNGFAMAPLGDTTKADLMKQVDMNFVKTGDGRFIELQGTAEGQPFDRRALDALMELADNELLDIFLGRQKPPANLDRPEVRQVIEAVRATR
jgi:ribonuclease PH